MPGMLETRLTAGGTNRHAHSTTLINPSARIVPAITVLAMARMLAAARRERPITLRSAHPTAANAGFSLRRDPDLLGAQTATLRMNRGEPGTHEGVSLTVEPPCHLHKTLVAHFVKLLKPLPRCQRNPHVAHRAALVAVHRRKAPDLFSEKAPATYSDVTGAIPCRPSERQFRERGPSGFYLRIRHQGYACGTAAVLRGVHGR